jgi:cytochrome c peroxidase
MHDGRFATLEAVLDHYSSGGKNHPNRDIRVQPLHFTESEKAAVIAFLKTLTDPTFLTDLRFSDPFRVADDRKE